MLSNEEKNTLKNIGLQFFAEGGAGGDSGTGGSEGGSEGGEGGSGEGTGGKSGKTFTQEEVNRLMKTEKESAKKALLKELGVEDAKSAKEGLAKYKEILDKDKSAAEKAGEALATEQKAKAEEKRKAAEESLAALREQLAAAQKAAKEAAITGDKDMATFDVLFLQGQELGNKMRGILLKLRGRDDQSGAGTVQKAMRALGEAIGRAAE